MEYEIAVRTIEPQPVMSVRLKCHAAEIGAVLREVLPEVWRHIEHHEGRPAGPPFTRYHDYADGRVDLEAGIPVESPLPEGGRVRAGELPGGRVVTTVHVGPYEKLPEAHDALHVWMREHGHAPDGPQWEYYLTDPGEEPDSSRWRTELVWPIRDA